jgi:hypothetical protein
MNDATWILIVVIFGVLATLVSTIVRGLRAKPPELPPQEKRTPPPEDEDGW